MKECEEAVSILRRLMNVLIKKKRNWWIYF